MHRTLIALGHGTGRHSLLRLRLRRRRTQPTKSTPPGWPASTPTTNRSLGAAAGDSGFETEVTATDVAYWPGAEVTGYLARPADGTARGGIIVIQEWWGLNDNIRTMARRFAQEGYVALAVDLYEGGVAKTRDEAMALMRRRLASRAGAWRRIYSQPTLT